MYMYNPGVGALTGYDPGGYYRDNGSGKGDMRREEGAAGHILELTVAGTPENPGGNSGKNSAKSLTGPGGDMVHWGFGKAELLPLTFQQMRIKFRERISKTLTGVWEGWYTIHRRSKNQALAK